MNSEVVVLYKDGKMEGAFDILHVIGKNMIAI